MYTAAELSIVLISVRLSPSEEHPIVDVSSTLRFLRTSRFVENDGGGGGVLHHQSSRGVS